MKIGLIADVHGDLDGLERALKLLRSKVVDLILCAGDLVDRGTDGDAVASRIRAEQIPCVQGNHDWWAQYSRHPVQPMPHGLFDQDYALSSQTIDYLSDLPRNLKFTFEERTVLVAHATPWDIDTYIYPGSDIALYKRVLREAGTHYVILGHTHLPMVVHIIGHGTIINPGSIYKNFTSLRYPAVEGQSCAILHLPYGDIEHYDINRNEFMPAVHRKL